MKPKKGYARQKKEDQLRQLLLHQWVKLAEEIHHNKKVANPYEAQFLALITTQPISQQILFKHLVKSIAQMNASSRTSGDNQQLLLCSESDNLNALQLILPQELQLKPIHADILAQLATRFGTEAFTYQAVGMVLKCSHSSVKRKLQPLLLFNKLEKLTRSSQRQTLLKLVEQQQTTAAYEQALEEWEDVRGWTDLTQRT